MQMDTKLKQANLETGFYNIINGERSSLGGELAVINPADGRQLAVVPDITRAALDEAVAAARNAFPGWSATSIQDRKATLASVLEEIGKHTEELSALLTAEQGRPLAGSQWEIGGLTHFFGPTFLGMDLPETMSESPVMGKVVTRYLPLGVVCAISPWNVPVLLSFTKVFPALLTGNTVVLKPSPSTPLTVLRICDYIRGLLPLGVFNVVTGGDALGAWMTSHAGFDKIAFTGSTQTGRKILESAAATLKNVTLELGGNDAGIVLPDANPGAIAEALFWSMFFLNGHVCMGLKRLYVHEDIYPQVTEALVAYAANIKTGDGFEVGSALGPVQNRLQYDRLVSTWKEIEQSGSNILFRGKVPQESEGFFYPVTMIDNPSDDASFVLNEVFGPIRSIMKYTDLDDAVRRANGTPYGLGASVWGEDAELLRSTAKRLNAGTVWINQHAVVSPDVPFTGHKESGLGVQFGLEGLESYCTIQVIATKS
jgi:acyl-CoA reductase-like NAD-dependent aldehyde dehydrogenase